MKRFVLLLALAGCAPDPAQVKAKAAADAAQAAADALPVYRVAVAKDGLLLTDPRGGAARPAPFGLRQSLLLAILARSFGTATEGHDTGCDRDFARWPNGLTLWFAGGTFAGWSLAGADAAIGVAPGLVRAPAMAAGLACE
ncbi:hypothetical protein [Polymorphobacter fuscus]|uniref:Uncharacterized protein n=1 Tax=Sandarakinorhabdus fusca TaxID=1439888 RepID=A0A7C9KN09_9SPHN|nr:hypothetical protein [Polymorphobacter fuscus]KAB7644916.1 hypothetical protein F9290_13145 [Polymorphobacter fuscus]MQT18203.1 hypothetical protein [Polymorphobacter fuscus]NJC09523.1 hypothetical protein [Polymorphobacter fuscus]